MCHMSIQANCIDAICVHLVDDRRDLRIVYRFLSRSWSLVGRPLHHDRLIAVEKSRGEADKCLDDYRNADTRGRLDEAPKPLVAGAGAASQSAQTARALVRALLDDPPSTRRSTRRVTIFVSGFDAAALPPETSSPPLRRSLPLPSCTQRANDHRVTLQPVVYRVFPAAAQRSQLQRICFS